MKIKKTPVTLPTVDADEIQNVLPRKEAVLLRMSAHDKKTISEAADKLGITTTEFFIKSALMVSAKIGSG